MTDLIDIIRYADQQFQSEGRFLTGFSLPKEFDPYWFVNKHPKGLEILHNHNPIQKTIIPTATVQDALNPHQLSLF